MPFKSPAQARLMRARAHGWKPDRIKGPSVKVAKEFVAADKEAKGMQYGGILRAIRKSKDTRTAEERWREKFGTEPLTLKQASGRVSSKRGAEVLTARRELQRAGWTQGREGKNAKWYPPQATALAPSEDVPPRTTQPIPGEGGLIAETPAAKAVTPSSLRAAIPERLRATVAGAGRTPPALLQYLQQLRGPAPEPVEMQRGGAFRGRLPPRMQGGAGRGQPGRGAASQFLTQGRVPQRGGGMGSDMGMQKFLRRGQVPGGGRPPQPGGGGLARAAVQPGPGAPPMKGIGRAPGAGVPLRGVGRPPGMGRPGAGGNVQAAVMPGRSFMPGGGGAGMPGGGNRIGMGDQQGAQARALQVQTGRPPMSRRQPFPGRGGPGGGFGRRRGRGMRGRMRR